VTALEDRSSRADDLDIPPEAAAAVIPDGFLPTTAKSRIISTELHNTADALELLISAANDEENRGQNSTTVLPQRLANCSRSPPSKHSDRPTQCNGSTEEHTWGQFLPVRKGILSKSEVREYLGFYWKTLWPLKPVIPVFYRDPSRYILLIEREPLLVLTLLVLTSRYHPLTGSRGEIRSERIHFHTWKYLQKYLNSVLWGSTCTRSLGAIASLLLLIEWHTKAFNNPIELSDDLEAISSQQSLNFLQGSPVATTSASTIQQRYEVTVALERLNILSPAYRSNKISQLA
jgi:hypothetical protein